jgi:IS5 family transposase
VKWARHKMRKKTEKQMPLTLPNIDHPKAKELETISFILDRNDTILDLVYQDLSMGQVRTKGGATGMTTEQVLRAALVKQMNDFTYRDLAFHIADSESIRIFMRMGFASRTFRRSTLQDNISKISPATWEEINRVLLDWAKSEKVDKGRQVRIDCTVVETNIHQPTDSSLLYDCVRVLDRLLKKVSRNWDGIFFQNHDRRAKRRMMNILNAKNKPARIAAYRDLIKITTQTAGYAEKAIARLTAANSIEAADYTLDLVKYVALTRRVINQTETRVLKDETVPASEKVVSIFEPHTDIIVKDRRETHYGHKVCLCVGASQLITDCLITTGNPADSTLVENMLDRQKEIYDRYPLKAAFDGGFASKSNLEIAKRLGIKDVCFAKRRGMEIEDMCRSEWVYKRLRNFRAGVESVISWVKRSLGLDRCAWKGFQAFGSYVWLSVVSANLRTLARHQQG